jgi:hypothetical protein
VILAAAAAAAVFSRPAVPPAFFQLAPGSGDEREEALYTRLGAAAGGAFMGAVPGLGWVTSNLVCPNNHARPVELFGFGAAGLGAVALGFVGWLLADAVLEGKSSPTGLWAFYIAGGGAAIADVALLVNAFNPGRCSP